MRVARRLWPSLAVLTLLGVTLASQPRGPMVLAVQADRPGAGIAETMFGIFYEDINFAADGGLYPELVKNRSFEFPDPLMGWYKSAGEGAPSRCARTRPRARATRTTSASRCRARSRSGS